MIADSFNSLNINSTAAVNSSVNNYSYPLPTFELGEALDVGFYVFEFLLASVGNVLMFLVLVKNLKRARANRVYLLLLHLNIADLLVTFVTMPSKIIMAATASGWFGPDWLCRFVKYLDVFGLYLSSNVLICMSIDRVFAVVRPFYSMRGLQMVKIMLTVAWLLAAASSLPQFWVFRKVTHPTERWFTACLTPKLGTPYMLVLGNTIVNGLECYAITATVIVTCFTIILCKIVHEEHLSKEAARGEMGDGLAMRECAMRRSSQRSYRKAKSRTLRMTFVIVTAFLVCWTPYFVIVALDLSDRDHTTNQRIGKIKFFQWHPFGSIVIPRLLFALATFNSCINPYIYARFSFNLRTELANLCPRLFAASGVKLKTSSTAISNFSTEDDRVKKLAKNNNGHLLTVSSLSVGGGVDSKNSTKRRNLSMDYMDSKPRVRIALDNMEMRISSDSLSKCDLLVEV